ncbi:hypothetical protein QOZ80_7BG0582970 [Eleusine coracana subsp. coracana]|nr:hypothetical protein QOZ80_7BG0582970 [Eleusine coracana subsp. coracana]
MMGFLSSVVSKALRQGQAVHVVRCEEVAVAGGLARHKTPGSRASGPTPGRSTAAPSTAWSRARRPAGEAALGRLRAVLRLLQPGHKYCRIRDLAKEVGWNRQETIRELEKKEKAKVTYDRRKQLIKLRVETEKAAEDKLGSQLDILVPIKY